MAQTIETVPGPQLTYVDQATFGAVTSRKEVIITPKYGGSFTAGNILRFEIPAQDFIDPDTVYMSFKTELFAGAGNNWIANTVDTHLDATSGIPFIYPERYVSSDINCMKTVRFKPGVQCIFNRVKVLAGSTTIEDIQDYADLYRFMMEATTSHEWRTSEGAEQEGFYDPEDIEQTITVSNHHSPPNSVISYTATSVVGVGHHYTIRPMLGLLGIGKLLPVKYMGNITLEFYLAENTDCLWSSTSSVMIPAKVYTAPAVGAAVALAVSSPTYAQTVQLGTYPSTSMVTAIDGNTLACVNTGAATYALGKPTVDFPNASYRISDCELHVQFCTVVKDFDDALQMKIESDGLDLHFSTFHEHVRQITATSRQTMTFTERSLSVKGGFVLMRNSDDLRDIRSDLTFMSNNISQFQWKIGNEYIPAQPVESDDGGARALVQLKMALGTMNMTSKSNCISTTDFFLTNPASNVNTQDAAELRRCASQPSKFAIGLNLEKSPGQMSGFDSAAAGVDIELQLTLETHTSKINGTNAAGTSFAGNVGGIFQPSKYKCNIVGTPWDNAAVASTGLGLGVSEFHGPGAYSLIYRNKQANITATGAGGGNVGGEYCDKDYNRRPGVMVTKDADCAFLHDAGNMVQAAMLVASIPTFTATNATGKYVRVQFYAHVDSLLRLRRIGQLEVVV